MKKNIALIALLSMIVNINHTKLPLIHYNPFLNAISRQPCRTIHKQCMCVGACTHMCTLTQKHTHRIEWSIFPYFCFETSLYILDRILFCRLYDMQKFFPSQWFVIYFLKSVFHIFFLLLMKSKLKLFFS